MYQSQTAKKKVTRCDVCGSTNVAWKQNHGGKWYLQNQKVWTGTETFEQRTYPNGPHFKTCAETRKRTLENMRARVRDEVNARCNAANGRLYARWMLVLQARKDAGIELTEADVMAWFEGEDRASQKVTKFIIKTYTAQRMAEIDAYEASLKPVKEHASFESKTA